jgi:hypothetical protein
VGKGEGPLQIHAAPLLIQRCGSYMKANRRLRLSSLPRCLSLLTLHRKRKWPICNESNLVGPVCSLSNISGLLTSSVHTQPVPLSVISKQRDCMLQRQAKGEAFEGY